MRKLALMLAQCLLLAGCTGLPQPREMGEMALLRTVGVDAVEQGVRLTVSTGPRASGVEGEKEPPLILRGEGESLSAAAFSLRQKSDRSVFFGYVDKILLGEEPGNVSDLLGWFAQDGELSLGAGVWLLQGTTAAAVVENGGETGVEGRLSALEQDGKLGRAPMTRTAGEVYSNLLDRGCAFVPVLAPGEELTPAGYGILKGDAVAGYLTGDAARGLELLAEEPVAKIIEVSLPGNRVSLGLTGAQLDCRPIFKRGELIRLELTSRVEIKPIQWQTRPTARERDALRTAAGQVLKDHLEQALIELQGWGTDCVGIGSRVAIAAPWHWEALEENWPAVFRAVDCYIEVEAALN